MSMNFDGEEVRDPLYTVSAIVEGALDAEEYDDYLDLAMEKAEEMARVYQNVPNTRISIYDTFENQEVAVLLDTTEEGN